VPYRKTNRTDQKKGRKWLKFYAVVAMLHWGDPDVDERIILRRIFRKWEGVVGTGWCWLRIGAVGGHL
jgi:hypothetical protein